MTTVLRVVFDASARDADLTAVAATERLSHLGAEATDVDVDGTTCSAYGLFDAEPDDALETARNAFADDPAAYSARRLPIARRFDLGDLRRRPVTLGGVEILAPGPPPAGCGASRLVIEQGGAFGVGLHPTTAMMLVLAAEGGPPDTVLDVGTGTGILALAALVRGAHRAVGTDIAPAARVCARGNAARNGLDRLVVRETIPAGERFDLVLANVRAAAIVALMPALDATLDDRGRLLVSGIRFYEHGPVEAAAAHRGLSGVGRVLHDGWWCLEFAR